MREHKTLLKIVLLCFACLVAGTWIARGTGEGKTGVTVVRNDAARRVDILVDGKAFASYVYPVNVYKPILFPLRSPSGNIVTRGFPLEPRPGESKDHPHHTGAWFNYGDVNGVDFWGHSDATKPEELKKMGTIFHRSIKEAKSGKDHGELEVTADWVIPDGSTILREETEYVFRATADSRIIDRTTKLTALDKRARFNDTKEGAFAIRVAKSLEHPSKDQQVFTDARGNKTAVGKKEAGAATGFYLSSEGKTGDEVWGTRGRWVILTGMVNGEPLTLGIFDYPKNPGYPTYWHARGYGLFSANPFGWKDFTNKKEEFNFAIEPKQSATFRWRVWIWSGKASADQAEGQYKKFVSEVK
ncbi:MAG TPA: PmoA family protein [Acidobacteriota bacterium]|nr:PmoA family protein [Acidobacteriota bacterium]